MISRLGLQSIRYVLLKKIQRENKYCSFSFILEKSVILTKDTEGNLVCDRRVRIIKQVVEYRIQN